VATHTTLSQLPLTGVNTHLNICHYFDFLLPY
jgi:hypothetical protein